jgi:hypothetical protein
MKKKRKKEATTAETSRCSIETTRESSEPTTEFVFVVAMTVEDTPGCERRGTARQKSCAMAESCGPRIP